MDSPLVLCISDLPQDLELRKSAPERYRRSETVPELSGLARAFSTQVAGLIELRQALRTAEAEARASHATDAQVLKAVETAVRLLCREAPPCVNDCLSGDGSRPGNQPS
jgi:hypothetical protein